MINSDKVIKIANGNNGYVTTKMIKESGIPTIELTRLIKQNKLERISRGYYVLKGSFNFEYCLIALVNISLSMYSRYLTISQIVLSKS